LKAPVNTARKHPLIGENGENPEGAPEEKRFNDALKRMLTTPPKPHEKPGKFESKPKLRNEKSAK
jgi:hypothetical protein